MYVCCTNKDSSHEVDENERRKFVQGKTSSGRDRTGAGNSTKLIGFYGLLRLNFNTCLQIDFLIHFKLSIGI